MFKGYQGYQIGATLYMPVVHPKAREVLAGEQIDFSRSTMVLCLEDAVAPKDLTRGLTSLAEGMAERTGRGRDMIYIRPRDLAMARHIATFPGIDTIDGMVVSHFAADTAPEWFALARDTGLKLMPTVETTACYDPAHVHALAAVLVTAPDLITMVRIGGNDLLSRLGLRRERGRTAYEGALAWVLPMISSILMSNGLPVSAPVFDIIDDLDTLAREVERDVAMGFQSKTAIHPDQIPVIEEAFAVGRGELNAARAVLNDGASAIFQIGGAMCAPATHREWAERIMARHKVFGVRGRADVMRSLRSV